MVVGALRFQLPAAIHFAVVQGLGSDKPPDPSVMSLAPNRNIPSMLNSRDPNHVIHITDHSQQ
jgi:hypothetical protein